MRYVSIFCFYLVIWRDFIMTFGAFFVISLWNLARFHYGIWHDFIVKFGE